MEKCFRSKSQIFTLKLTDVGHGNGRDRVKTTALMIECSSTSAPLLRELLMRAAKDKLLTQGIFVPVGIAKMIGQESFRGLISKQNEMLFSTATIGIKGLLHNILDVTMSNPQGEIMTIQSFVLNHTWCKSIEPTNQTKEIGKFLIVTNKGDDLAKAREFFDTTFQDLIGTHPEIQAIRNRTGMVPVQRADRTTTTSPTTISYAQSLRGYLTPQSNNTQNQLIPQPPKRAWRGTKTTTIQFDDENEFPALAETQLTSNTTNTSSRSNKQPRMTIQSSPNTRNPAQHKSGDQHTLSTISGTAATLYAMKSDLELMKQAIMNSMEQKIQRAIENATQPFKETMEMMFSCLTMLMADKGIELPPEMIIHKRTLVETQPHQPTPTAAPNPALPSPVTPASPQFYDTAGHNAVANQFLHAATPNEEWGTMAT